MTDRIDEILAGNRRLREQLQEKLPKKSGGGIGKTIVLIFLVFFALLLVRGTFYTIDQGERGVVLANGKLQSIADPGLHFKIPAINRIVRIPVRTTTGKLDNILSYSSDQQPAKINLSVTFAVSNNGVGALYEQFGSINNAYERVIVPLAKQELKTVFGQFTALRAVQNRETLNTAVRSAVTDALKAYPYLVIQNVQIENIDFSDAYEQTIEDRMKAEVEVERYKQNLQREKIEAEIAVTRAQAQADSQVKAAEGEAKAILLRAEAEAKAITQKAAALQQNPNIISLMQVEKWNGTLPQTMVPNGTLPMLPAAGGR